MPYRNAYVVVLVFLALTFVAFWPSYLKDLPAAKIAWHFHAASAVLWTILAALQSWSIHNDRLALHRTAGLAVFVLFPFFLVAGVWVIHLEATTLAGGLTDPTNIEIGQIGIVDLLANGGFALLFWGGLKYRYKVHLHARYMLGTLMFVVGAIIWRLLRGYVPMFDVKLVPFSYVFALSNAVPIAIALYLYWQAPRHGRPFLLVAGIIAAQELLFETLGRVDGWAWAFSRIAYVNLPFLLVATGIVSLGIAWHGWVAGARPRAPQVAAAA
jgi:hypothetical protein